MEDVRLLGDWKLLKQLGQGSMGTVFVAEHRFTKRQYALKILPEELAQDRGFMQRFEEEIGVLSLLDHPHIVKTYNVSFSQGIYFLVTDCIVDELSESTNLQQYMHSMGNKITQEEILDIVTQVAQGVDYGHSVFDSEKKPLIHRSLKLNNILIGKKMDASNTRSVFISDWGLSKIIGTGQALLRTFRGVADGLSVQAPSSLAYPNPPLSQQKIQILQASLLQNFIFLAPEQKKSDAFDCKVDNYAFGVLVYYLLMKEFPEGAFCMPSSTIENPIINWDFVVTSLLNPKVDERPENLQELLEKAKHAKTAKQNPPIQQTTQSQTFTDESILPKPPKEEEMDARLKASSVEIKPYDRFVKEYHPEKGEDRTIIPILTETCVVKGGYYFRGNDQGCRDEMPRHKIKINSFAIDIHPVTNEQFVRYFEYVSGEKDAQNHDIIRLKDSRIKKSAGRISIEPGYAKHPVVGVTWYGAIGYAQWVGKRLPSEAEWEIACCGGLENPLYPTGDSIEKTEANFFSSDTTAVMSYPPNGYGIFDMAGNVYEWCQDWYEYTYYETSTLEPDFPKGPLQGVYRVLRGGCWKSLSEDLRTSKRHRNNPWASNGTYGFRCAKDVNG